MKTETPRLHLSKRISMYVALQDIWIGVFIGPNDLYFLILPCLVIKISRKNDY